MNKLTIETVTDAEIQALGHARGDEWIEAEGRRLRLSWWVFDALHSHNAYLRERGRRICVEVLNNTAQPIE